jgi:uncharacterized delta-60 repeat protein
MAFIDKKDPLVLNIKLTSKGRELISKGQLNFKYFAIGDSEIDYDFVNKTNYNPFYSSILRPADKNPQQLSFILKNLNGEPYNELLNVPSTPTTIENQIGSVGFFNENGDEFITETSHVKQPDVMIVISGVTGGTELKLNKAPTYQANPIEPEVGDLLFVKWTNPIGVSTTGHTINKNAPMPNLMYRIDNVISGSLNNNNLIVNVDRELPDFSTITGGSNSVVAGALVYYNYINFTGDTGYSTDNADEALISFLQNCQCPTIRFPFWNLSVIYTENIIGVKNENKQFFNYKTNSYAGFISYIQNQSPIYRKLGVIHYTNNSVANTYAEGFYGDPTNIQDVSKIPTLNMPTIMWHKSSGITLGAKFKAIGSVKYLTGVTKSLNTRYFDLADENNNVIGKVFYDLKIFLIEDQELLFAISYKSNRSWTLPNYGYDLNADVTFGCPQSLLDFNVSGITPTTIGGDNGSIVIYDLTGYVGNPNNNELILEIDTTSVITSEYVFNDGFYLGSITNIVLTSDGKMLVGGSFSSYNGITSNRIIRLNSDGSVDNTFLIGTGFDSQTNSIKIQSDGKILVGGLFTSYKGITSNNIIRLNSDGSVDNTFSIGTGFNGSVNTITLQSDGKILVGGSFTSYKGITSNNIIGLNSDGSVDNTFSIGTGFNGSVNTITLQSDGKILVGGSFSSYKGISSNNIIRLNSDGSVDNTFSIGTGFSSFVRSITLQSDGKILVGGFFTSYNSVTANRIIRLNSNGSVDNTFLIGTGFDNSSINIITLQSDGKILVGGSFTSYKGITSNRIIRLNSDGSVDNTFSIGTGFNGQTNSINIQSDGKILVGGSFSSYKGITSNSIIRLKSDGSIDTNDIVGTEKIFFGYITGDVTITNTETINKIIKTGTYNVTVIDLGAPNAKVTKTLTIQDPVLSLDVYDVNTTYSTLIPYFNVAPYNNNPGQVRINHNDVGNPIGDIYVTIGHIEITQTELNNRTQGFLDNDVFTKWVQLQENDYLDITAFTFKEKYVIYVRDNAANVNFTDILTNSDVINTQVWTYYVAVGSPFVNPQSMTLIYGTDSGGKYATISNYLGIINQNQNPIYGEIEISVFNDGDTPTQWNSTPNDGSLIKIYYDVTTPKFRIRERYNYITMFTVNVN